MLARGTLLVFRPEVDRPVRVIDLQSGRTRWWLPPGVVASRSLIHQDGRLVTWFDLTTGARVRSAFLDERGTFALVGASADGSRAVLARPELRTTTFALVSASRDTAVFLPGNRWTFVALAHGSLYTRHNGELWRDELGGSGNRPIAVLGPELLQLTSADGRYVFAVSVLPSGTATVLLLNLDRGIATAVRLPGRGNATAAATYTLLADPDGRHLWAISPGYGRVVHIDVVARRVDDAYGFSPGRWNAVSPNAAMAPDGETIAVTDATHLWFVHLAARRVVRGPSHTAIALGYSPDEKRLWVVGQRSRVSPLPVR